MGGTGVSAELGGRALLGFFACRLVEGLVLGGEGVTAAMLAISGGGTGVSAAL